MYLEDTTAVDQTTWLANPSFQTIPDVINSKDNVSVEVPSTSLADKTESSHHKDKKSKSLKHKKEHKHKKKKKSLGKDKNEKILEPIQFDGTEEYYVDKKSERGFLSVSTLHKPACPR